MQLILEEMQGSTQNKGFIYNKMCTEKLTIQTQRDGEGIAFCKISSKIAIRWNFALSQTQEFIRTLWKRIADVGEGPLCISKAKINRICRTNTSQKSVTLFQQVLLFMSHLFDWVWPWNLQSSRIYHPLHHVIFQEN